MTSRKVIERIYPYVWRWGKFPRDTWDLAEVGRYQGQPCRVLAWGGRCNAPGYGNKAAVEWLDGYQAVVSRNGLAKAPTPLVERWGLLPTNAPLNPGDRLVSPAGLRCEVHRIHTRVALELRQVARYHTVEGRWVPVTQRLFDWTPTPAWQAWRRC